MDFDKFRLIFWDFDGVIKESVSVKIDGFVELFQSFGDDVCNKIKKLIIYRKNSILHL